MKTRLLTLISIISIFVFPLVHLSAQSTWATAAEGGSLGFGTILKGDSDGTNFHAVYSFDSTNGSFPVGRMVMADNGKIYGVTELGGCQDSCTVFSYDTATNTYTCIYQFFQQVQLGGVPYAGLISGGNGYLYGTTFSGGSQGAGVIYTINTSNDTYTDVHDFPGGVGLGQPISELTPALNGKLYGLTTTYSGGTFATLFSIDPANNQYDSICKVPYPFSFGTIGASKYSRGTPLIQANDQKLYGYLFSNSADTAGLLFNYDLSSGVFSLLHAFTIAEGGPVGGLVQAVDGKIYGTTFDGSLGGIIYGYDITANFFTSLMPLTFNTGFNPTGGLTVMGADLLIGSTAQGGGQGYGEIFTFQPSTNNFSSVLALDLYTTGSAPICEILLTKPYTQLATSLASNKTSADMQVYPNPATDQLYIRNAVVNAPYTITNSLGQQITKGTFKNGLQIIDVTKLPAGVYMLNDRRFLKE